MTAQADEILMEIVVHPHAGLAWSFVYASMSSIVQHIIHPHHCNQPEEEHFADERLE